MPKIVVGVAMSCVQASAFEAQQPALAGVIERTEVTTFILGSLFKFI
jgi:hypothetical protein